MKIFIQNISDYTSGVSVLQLEKLEENEISQNETLFTLEDVSKLLTRRFF